MYELNKTEIEAVSGAGFWADLGKAIGSAIGGVVDRGTALGGLSTDATTPAGQLGSGIGSLLEFNIVSAINDIGGGIIGIVEFGINAITQARK